MTRRVPLAWVVAIAVFATYLVAARGPRNLFPLSVFDMYQGHAPDVVARVLVVDAQGETAEVDAYDAWSCTWVGSLDDVESTCGPSHRPIPYVTRDQLHYLESHGGQGDEAVQLVSRAYALSSAPAWNDCVLARCVARRRPE